MVFVLAIFPRYRSALLGIPEYSPSNVIAKMNLTGNDIRTIHLSYSHSGRVLNNIPDKLLGDNPMPWNQRFRKLQTLGLVKRSSHPGLSGNLTEEGFALGRFIEQCYRTFVEERQK
jgi:hypothetical protein